MEVKKGAVISGLNIKMRIVLIEAERIWKELGRNEGVTITSGLDGVHSAGSLHPYGYAVDLRTYYFTPEQANLAYTKLNVSLPSGYDVVKHDDHIHVEYDNAKNY